MLLLILFGIYSSVFIFDFLKIRKKQNKSQNIIYLFLFFTALAFSLSDVLGIPIPKFSEVLRSIIGK